MAEQIERRRLRGIVSGPVSTPNGPTSAFSALDGTVEIVNVAQTRNSSGEDLAPGEGTVLSVGPDDTFVDASYIKTGVLDANLLRTGQLQTIASWNNKNYGSTEDSIESQQGFTGGYVYLEDWYTVSENTVYVKFADWAGYEASNTVGTTAAGNFFEVGDYVRVSGAYFGQDGDLVSADGTNANVGLVDQDDGPVKYGSVVAVDTTGTGLFYSVTETGKTTLDAGKLARSQDYIPTISRVVRVSSITSTKLGPPNPSEIYEVVVTTLGEHGLVVGDYVELASCGQVFSGVWYVVATPDENTFIYRNRFGIDADASLNVADLPDLSAPTAIRVRKAYAVSSNGDLTAASINIRTARTQSGGNPIFQVLNDSVVIRKPDGTVLLSATTVGSSIDVGTVTADEITVGGDVDPNQIVRVGTNVSPAFQGIWAGNASPTSAEFSVDLDGNLVASNANISGTIQAAAGSIGGFTIGATALTATNIVADSSGYVSVGSGDNVAVMSGVDPTYRFWAGNNNPASTNAKFKVEQDGSVTVSDLTVTGGSIQIGNFTLNTAGNITDDLIMTQTRIQNDSGVTLIDTDSSGSSAVSFGAATRRLLLSGIENGDFSAGAPDSSTAIGSGNPLPYYTYTQGTNTGITAKWLDSYTYGNGNAIKWEIAANNADTSLSPAYIERIVPVSATASKRYGIWVNASWGTGSDFSVGGAAGETYFEAQYLKADGTTTGTADVAGGYAFDSIGTDVGIYDTCKPNDSWVPTDAVALRIRVGVVQATSPIGIYPISIHLEELQLNIGKDINIFTDLGDPATYSPGYINQLNGVLNINSGSNSVFVNGAFATTGNITSQSGNITATTGNITAGGNGTISGVLTATNLTSSGNITLNSGGDVILQMDGNDVIVQDTEAANGTNPRIMFRDKNGTTYTGIKSGAANVVQILNGTSTTDYAQLWAERIYPMNGSTASRYIYDDGTRTAFSAGIDVNASSMLTSATFSSNVTITGELAANGSIVDPSPLTTTATTNAAIWVIPAAGEPYGLRRNTSSARYKTNIEDADEAVLEAARKVKPRHYESTIPDEAGATRLGFIAEEVYDAGLTHAVGLDAEGRPETLDSVALIAALFARVNDLEDRIAELEGRA